jgi:hypothetical protein
VVDAVVEGLAAWHVKIWGRLHHRISGVVR